MVKARSTSSSDSSQKVRPALSPEARENQMIALAMDVVEKRLRDGTASSQETTHFLKLASSKERLEKEILGEQKKLISAKTKAIEDAPRMDQMFKDAINAMREYSGQGGSDDY